MIHLLTGVSVFLAWLLGLSFIRMKRVAVLFNAGIAAALSVILCWLVQAASLESFVPAVLLGLFLLETVAVQLQTRGRYGNSVLAFCFAEAALAVFVPLCRMPRTVEGPLALVPGGVFFAAFFAVFRTLRRRFPGGDWHEYFGAEHQDPKQLNIRPVHVYATALAPCVFNTALLTLPAVTVTEAVIVSAAAFGLLWLGVMLIILLTSYKKERLTVLLEQQFRTETQAFMNVIRSQRHDYNFHVQAISGLLAGGKVEECRSYVKALEKDTTELNVLMPVRDPAIAAAIFSFRSLAIREGIELHIDITYDLAQIATNVYETTKIISNLLQNAIDEVTTHTDKSYGIWLTILKRGEFCVIRVSNRVRRVPTAEELGRLYQQGYTTKDGHEGVGLSSIRLLAQRYHGIVFAQTEDDVIHFIARIPINAIKREEC